MSCRVPLSVLPLLLVAPAAWSQALTPAPSDPAAAVTPSPWSGSSGELGYASARGNSTTDNLNAKLKLRYTDGDWIHSFDATAQSSSDEDGTTAERYTGSAGTALQLGEHRQLTATGRYEHDNFATYDRLATFSIGYGWRLIDRQRFYLDVQLGPGLRRAHNADEDEMESGPIARGQFDLKYSITDNTNLTNTLLVEAGSYNTYTQNDFGLQVNMNARLALKAAWQLRHNSDVNDDDKRTDTLTTVNLVYTLK